jgi:hypothetical protein
VIECAVVISHPNPTWPKCRNIHTTQDGHLLCITRHVLFDTCLRLKEENLADDATMVVVRDASDAVPDVAGRVADVINLNYGAHATARRR